MSSNLVAVLHQEERSIVAELRASRPFQRLEAIRRLLALYGEQPSIAAGLDTSAEAERGGGEVIHFAAAPAVVPPAPGATAVQAAVHAAVAAPPTPAPVAAAPTPAVSPIPVPGPAAAAAAVPAAATKVAAIAEAAVADVVARSPAPPAPVQKTEAEPASVVSSVRAALLGIGKG